MEGLLPVTSESKNFIGWGFPYEYLIVENQTQI